MIDLHHGDFLTWGKPLRNMSFDLVFADPPFGIGYNYGDGEFQDTMGRKEYLAFSHMWLYHAWNKLSPTGSLWIAIGDEYAAELCVLAKGFGLTLRNWCVWYYTFGVHLDSKFGRNKTHLLYFVNDPKNCTFNPDSIRIQSERQRIGDKRANVAGRVPGDVWFDDLFDVPRLPGNAKERTSHPCQMPEAVLRRIILGTSNEGDHVLDPFGGSFVTAKVCKELGRSCVSGDTSAAFFKAGLERLRNVTPSLFSAARSTATPADLETVAPPTGQATIL